MKQIGCESSGPLLRMKPASVEQASEENGSTLCSEEWSTLITSLLERKKHIKWCIIGCSGKIISNILKWNANPERHGRKQKTTIKMDLIKVTRKVFQVSNQRNVFN